MNALLRAVSCGISTALASDQLKVVLKEVFLQTTRNDVIKREAVGTIADFVQVAGESKRLRMALLQVMAETMNDTEFTKGALTVLGDTAKNDEIRTSALLVAKTAVRDLMNDNTFMADVTSEITHSGLSVMRDEDIRDAMISVAKVAIVEALRDEQFLATLRETAASSLSDGILYRGAARGVVGALNPFGGGKKKSEEQEDDHSPRRKLKRPDGLPDSQLQSSMASLPGNSSWGDFDSVGGYESCGFRSDSEESNTAACAEEEKADEAHTQTSSAD